MLFLVVQKHTRFVFAFKCKSNFGHKYSPVAEDKPFFLVGLKVIRADLGQHIFQK